MRTKINFIVWGEAKSTIQKIRRKIGEDYPSYLSKFDIASTYGDTKSIARENTSTLLARNVHLSMLHYLYLILEVILSASLCR